MNLMAFCVAAEQIKDAGEDCFAFDFSSNGGYAAVFDGCGGMGAKRYPALSNQTGARIAALTAGFVTDYLYSENLFHIAASDSFFLKEKYEDAFKIVKETYGDIGGLKIAGKMYKELPTTVALSVIKRYNSELKCEYIWAGDSRGYLLDVKGLWQVTDDDLITKEDAFDNLRNDGVLSNVINADQDFVLHRKVIEIDKPSLVIVSTDGGFGYFQTPMEFEYVILSSLYRSESVKEWKSHIKTYVSEYACDDFSVIVVCCGFDNVGDWKSYFKRRYSVMEKLMSNMQGKSEDQLKRYWELYKSDYYRMKNG